MGFFQKGRKKKQISWGYYNIKGPAARLFSNARASLVFDSERIAPFENFTSRHPYIFMTNNIQQAKQYIENAKAVIFDADGLLFDSEPMWRQTRQEILRRRNIIVDPMVSTGTKGMGLRESIEVHKKFFGYEGDVELLLVEYREVLYELLLAKEDLLFSGVEELIKKLFHEGKKLAIATGGHTPKGLQLLLDKFGLTKYFDFLASCDDVENGKPAPDVYLYAAKKLEVSPEAAVVMEDAGNGTKAGKSAGMIVIGVNRDEKGKEELRNAGADVIIESLEELL